MSSSQFQCHRDVINDTKVRIGAEDDLTRFSVQVPKDSSAETISSYLAQTGAGRLEGDEAAVSIEWLRRRTVSPSQQWHGDFDRMLAYASSRGWMDSTGEAVIAHVERV
jgi:hypothetical protein